MKRKFFPVILLLIALLLTACGLPEKTELNERLIIEAVGVDGADGGVAVTVQALNDLSATVDDGAPEDGVTRCYTFYGATVGEALAQVAPRTGLTPLYSQARLLALGFSIAQNDVSETLDFFLREHHTRADITVAVAEHTAREIVSAPFGQNRVGADLVQDALRETGSGGAPLTPLYRFMDLLLSETDAAFCPLLGLEQDPISEEPLVCCRGAVLFQGTKIRTVISADELTSLRALTDGLSGDSLTLNMGDIRCTLRIAKCKTKIRPARGTADCRFRLRINAACDITEVSAGAFTPLDTAQTDRIAEAASLRLTEAVAALLDKCFYRNGCDICRFYQRFRLLHPVRYRETAASLSPADFPCDIICKVSIRRTGKEVLRKQSRESDGSLSGYTRQRGPSAPLAAKNY